MRTLFTVKGAGAAVKPAASASPQYDGGASFGLAESVPSKRPPQLEVAARRR